MAFPTTLDTITATPAATATLATGSHTGIHTELKTIVESLQAKIGIDSSAVTTSHDYKLSGVTGTDKAVSKTGTETLTNKTFDSTTALTIKDSNLSIVNATTPSKVAKFDSSAITAATTRTFTLPDETTTLIGNDTTETLTNKTLTSPTINGGTLTSGTVATSTIDTPTINDATFTDSIIINSPNTDFGTLKGVTSGSSNGFILGTCRTSLSSPSASQSGDDLAVFKGIGYGATGWSGTRGSLIIEAAQNWTDSAQGTRILMLTTPSDSVTAAEGFRLANTGILGFAKSTKRYSSGTATKTSNTTVMDVDNLTFDVAASSTYVFYANLHCTAGASGGIKAAINGTATATAIVYDVTCNSGTSMATTRSTALGTTGGITAANPFVRIDGTITVNAAGTLKVEFAQNASNGTASTVVVGSIFHIEQVLN